jgi:hypothetical protein
LRFTPQAMYGSNPPSSLPSMRAGVPASWRFHPDIRIQQLADQPDKGQRF